MEDDDQRMMTIRERRTMKGDVQWRIMNSGR